MKGRDLICNSKTNEYLKFHTLAALAEQIKAFGNKKNIDGINKANLQENYVRALEVSETVMWRELLLIWYARQFGLVSQVLAALKDGFNAKQNFEKTLCDLLPSLA